MTRTNLDELESIARAATPGPWLTSKTSHDTGALCVEVPDGDDEMSLAWDAGFGITVMSAADATHVVATNPAATLALIAELRAERKRADEATESLDARWEHSDHTAAKYYRRMREAEDGAERLARRIGRAIVAAQTDEPEHVVVGMLRGDLAYEHNTVITTGSGE